MNVIGDMLLMCVGVVICGAVFDLPTDTTLRSMYWCCFGAGFMAVKHKLWSR